MERTLLILQYAPPMESVAHITHVHAIMIQVVSIVLVSRVIKHLLPILPFVVEKVHVLLQQHACVNQGMEVLDVVTTMTLRAKETLCCFTYNQLLHHQMLH